MKPLSLLRAIALAFPFFAAGCSSSKLPESCAYWQCVTEEGRAMSDAIKEEQKSGKKGQPMPHKSRPSDDDTDSGIF